MSETDILRQRLKEYRDLLHVCYLYIKNPTPEAKQKVLDALEQHGVNDGTV